VKMWSGRFGEPPDPDFEQWQRSFLFDWQLLPQETAASRAHAKTLAAAGILNPAELEQIVAALDTICAEYSAGIDAASRPEVEDIHHFVELELVARIGELGLKLHTGRSRNEQIATDLRLYVREKSASIQALLAAWAEELIGQARRVGGAVMPAYTHLQRAEPVLVAHWLQAYGEMLLRDIGRFEDVSERLNLCPLGSGAVAGATLKLDRAIAARELGFRAPTANSMDATSDRDFVLEFLQALTLASLHASRFAEEITLYATAEFGFVRLPERFSTGSSAMPQKKNPDLTELVRAKAGRIHGAAQTVTMVLKGLPLAYNKDLQETQEPVFAATHAAESIFRLLGRFTAALDFNLDRMRAACETGYLNAMAAATYLVHKGLPFRTAHERIGQAVRYGIERGRELDKLTLDELKRFAPEFEADFFSNITVEATLNCHDVIGGTAEARVRDALGEQERRIAAAVRGSRTPNSSPIVNTVADRQPAASNSSREGNRTGHIHGNS
jgi:argininosuccinate lyase